MYPQRTIRTVLRALLLMGLVVIPLAAGCVQQDDRGDDAPQSRRRVIADEGPQVD